MYPLKFLFVLVADQLLGYDTTVGSSECAIVEEIEAGQLPILMVIFGVGFVAVQLVFALLYLRAHVLRDVLGLDAYERSKTREEIQGFLLATGVGLIPWLSPSSAGRQWSLGRGTSTCRKRSQPGS
jgi:uncharacterized membrane protein YciS (DUF1049 family)